MKSTSKRLLALFLALTMCLSLLSVPVWAADVSGEASESAAVTQSEPEEAPADESAPEESEQAEESPDESPDASPEASSEAESEPEREPDPEDVPDASPEASSEAESEAEPEPDPEDVPDASPEASSEAESEPEPEPDPEDVPDASPEASSEPEPEPEETVTVQDTHTHDNESFTEWTDQLAKSQNGEDKTAANSLPVWEGNYYLSADVTLSSTWTVPSGGVKLCLNGKKVTGPTSGSVIRIDSGTSLSLYDESGGQIVGTATGNNRPNKGGGVFNIGSFTMEGGTITGCSAGFDGGGVYNYGTFTMHGGTITDCSANCGGGVCSSGSFTMHGGSISDCSAAPDGGGVYVYSNGSFTMKGGTITGGSATYGGGVCNYGSFTMNGGTITGCSAKFGGGEYNYGSFTMHGGTISGCSASYSGGGVLNYDTFNLSGKPVITGNKKGGTFTNGVLTGGTNNNVYLPSGKFLTVTGALETGAKVGVTLNTSGGKGVFTTGWNTYMSGKKPSDYFTSDNDALGVILNSSGEAELTSDHTHDSEVFTAWNETDSLPDSSGNYYLTQNVTLSSTWQVPSGGGVKLCLNGKKVTGPTKGSVIKINSGRSLSLYDESGGQIVGTATGDNRPYDGGGVNVDSKGSFTMNGGTISGCSAQYYGGGVYNLSSFTMHGGTITGCSAYYGAGVRNSGSFTMKGGTISDCSAEDYGGGVYVYDGSFTMHGGSITGCSANYGGGVRNSGSFTMKGGTISGCSANNGGGVFSLGTVHKLFSHLKAE